jgi:hypothetical protein
MPHCAGGGYFKLRATTALAASSHTFDSCRQGTCPSVPCLQHRGTARQSALASTAAAREGPCRTDCRKGDVFMSGQHVKTKAEATNPRDHKKRKKSLNAPAAAAAEDASRPSGRKSLTSAGTGPKCRPAADDIDGIFAGQARKRTAQARPAPQGQANALGAAELTQQHTKASALRL